MRRRRERGKIKKMREEKRDEKSCEAKKKLNLGE